LRFSLQFIEAGERPAKRRKSRLEQKVDAAEEQLHAVLGDKGMVGILRAGAGSFSARA
jgi:hypothetical protein